MCLLQASGAWLLQEGGSPFDGLVLMCTAKSAYVGRVLPEGRLVLLHNMPRPPDTPQVLLLQGNKGCLSWLASGWRGALGQGACCVRTPDRASQALMPECGMQGSVPYAAWRASPAQPAGKRAAVVAALAWDRQLLLLDVPLTRPADEAPAGMHASPLLLEGWSSCLLMCR